MTTLITAAKDTKCPWERGVLGIGQISREGEVETKDRVECPRREVLGFFYRLGQHAQGREVLGTAMDRVKCPKEGGVGHYLGWDQMTEGGRCWELLWIGSNGH